MNFLNRLLIVVICSASLPVAAAADRGMSEYVRTARLLQGFSGAGDELERAHERIDELKKKYPKSGYAEALSSEILVTWELDSRGRPSEVFDEVLRLADESSRLNPRLSLPYAAKAEAYIKVSKFDEAQPLLDKALELDPGSSEAIFSRADIFRRKNQVDEGEIWFRKFIAAVDDPKRKSNGHYWMARLYQDAAIMPTGAPNKKYLERARAEYSKSVELDPGAWKLVNFAMFQNGFGEDFDGAEKNARRALALMDFPMARYHIAAAQYQKLWARDPQVVGSALSGELQRIADSTGITLDQALQFRNFDYIVQVRLQELRSRLAERGSTRGR